MVRLLFLCEECDHCSTLLSYYLLKIITANRYLLQKSILYASTSVLHLHFILSVTKFHSSRKRQEAPMLLLVSVFHMLNKFI